MKSCYAKIQISACNVFYLAETFYAIKGTTNAYFSAIPQVIGVEGQNPSGFCLMATRIFDSVAHYSSTVLESEEPSAKRQISSQESKIPGSLQFTRVVRLYILPYFRVHQNFRHFG